MKKKTFFLGLLSGLVLANHWKFLTKEGIKTGIRAGRKVKEFSQQALEDIEDIRAEVAEELAEQDRGTQGRDA